MSLEHSPRQNGRPDIRPHLTRSELALRLNMTPVSVTRNYARWGLRPIKLGGRLLFPFEQVEALERRAMLEDLSQK
jgi:hypothetical protein